MGECGAKTERGRRNSRGHTDGKPWTGNDRIGQSRLDVVRPRETVNYSHSMVEGGLDVMSYTTRLTPGTVFVILFETC